MAHDDVSPSSEPSWFVATRRYLARHGAHVPGLDPDDLSQDVAVLVCGLQEAGIVLRSTEAMAVTIAWRLLRDHRAYRARHPETEPLPDVEHPDLASQWTEIEDILLQLPDDERELAAMRLAGQRLQSIARARNLSLAAVFRRLQRLREHLRAVLLRCGVPLPSPVRKKLHRRRKK